MPLKWVSKKVKHPCKIADELTKEELAELVDTLQDILWVGAESRGDFWDPNKLDREDEWTAGTGRTMREGALDSITEVMELYGLRPGEGGGCKR